MKNKEILLQIIELEKNKPVGIAKEYANSLKPGESISFKWYPSEYVDNGKLMKDGNYSARIVVEVFTSKREFIITSESKFNYRYNTQEKKSIINLDYRDGEEIK